MQGEPPSGGPEACPGCDSRLRAGARYCKECGHTIAISAVPPAQLAGDAAAGQARFARDWAELRRIAWLYGLMLLGSLVLGIVGRFDDSPWPETCVAGFDALLIVGFAATRHRELLPLLGRPRIGAHEALRLAGASLAIMALLSAYFAALQAIGVPFSGYSQSYRKAGWPVWSMFVMVSLMPALFEELAFRGVIQSSLERVLRGREPWAIQAVLFGVVHLLPLIFPSHVCMGLWLGWLRNRSGSLYPGMIAHATWNAWVLGSELYG